MRYDPKAATARIRAALERPGTGPAWPLTGEEQLPLACRPTGVHGHPAAPASDVKARMRARNGVINATVRETGR